MNNNYAGVFDQDDIQTMLESYLQQHVSKKLQIEEYTGYPKIDDLMGCLDATTKEYDKILSYLDRNDVIYLRLKGSQWDDSIHTNNLCRIHFFYTRDTDGDKSLLEELGIWFEGEVLVSVKQGITMCKHHWLFEM